MKTVHTLFPSLASLLPLLLLIAIYIRVGNVRRNDNNGLICWSMMTCITGMMNNKLSDENHASGNTTTTSLPFSFSFFHSCWLLYMMVLVRRMDRVLVCWWWCVYCISGAMNYDTAPTRVRQITIWDAIAISIVCRVWRIMCCPMGMLREW